MNETKKLEAEVDEIKARAAMWRAITAAVEQLAGAAMDQIQNDRPDITRTNEGGKARTTVRDPKAPR